MLEPDFEHSEDMLEGVDDYEDALAMGEAIFEQVKVAKSNDANEIHVSSAGGRKTMSSHCLAAMSTFGRLQDIASHTLVSPDYEILKDFWHPGYKSDVPLAGGLKPKDARVNLIEIPFVPLTTYMVGGAHQSLEDLTLRQVMKQIRCARQYEKQPSIELRIDGNWERKQGIVVIDCEEFIVSTRVFTSLYLLYSASQKADVGFSATFSDLDVFKKHEFIRQDMEEEESNDDLVTSIIQLIEKCYELQKSISNGASLNAAASYEYAMSIVKSMDRKTEGA